MIAKGDRGKPTDAKYVPRSHFFSYPLSISLVQQGLTGESDFDVEVTRCQHKWQSWPVTVSWQPNGQK